jgi:hypothetical protein
MQDESGTRGVKPLREIYDKPNLFRNHDKPNHFRNTVGPIKHGSRRINGIGRRGYPFYQTVVEVSEPQGSVIIPALNLLTMVSIMEKSFSDEELPCFNFFTWDILSPPFTSPWCHAVTSLSQKEQSSASIKSFFIGSLSSIFGSQVERLVPEYPLPIVHAKKLGSKYLFRADIVIP